MRKPLAWLLALAPAATVFAQSSKPAATTAPAVKDNTPIITVGKTPVPYSEFEFVYKKNNASADDAYTDKSVREYVDLYAKFKLKVMDAERLRLDTSSSFKQELEGYRRQLAQPYLTEKSVTDKLIKEAYDRMKEEIHAAHILINVDPQADPKDTLAAYTKILDVRRRAVAGEDFGKLAYEYSQDPSAKQNKGDLGYFSSMQMVYPFENAAFSTQKGQISPPVRTRFGYHLIKVLDRRPSQGQVQVAHIMVKANPGMQVDDSLAAAKKIQEIYQKLTVDKMEWKLAAATFSEDPGSKNTGGTLPMFGSGQMIPEFEDVAFKMKDTGDISRPFRTDYGWHIVKLIQKKPLEKYEDIESTLKTRVGRDSRSEQNRSALLARLRKEDNLVEFPKIKAKALAKGDTSLLTGRWRFKRADKLNKETLITISGQAHSVEDFFASIERNQVAAKKSSPPYLMQLAYNKFVDDQLMKYEEAHLADKYEDYRMLMKEYRDGILLFTLMDQKVWTKALEDTAGLRRFYESSKNNYRWDRRANATIYNVADQKTLELVKKRTAVRHYAVTEPGKQTLTFDKDAFKVAPKQMTDVRSAAFNIRNDENTTLEVTGYAASGEKAGTSRKRAKILYDSLAKAGVPASKMTLKDGGFMAKGAKPEDARKAEITYFSSSLKALERSMNLNSPLAVQITEGKFQKSENPVLEKLNWKVGDFTILDDPSGKGRITYVVISSIEEPRAKTLDEARGLVISDYQNQLEKEWVDGLKKENPVAVNDAEVKKLIRK